MRSQTWWRLGLLLISASGLTLGFASAGLAADPPVNFNRDIRPILSDRCFTCHGPDAKTRETELRFDSEESALADLGGYHAIIPGSPEKSALIARITDDDADTRMPPEGGKPLTAQEIALFRRWIQEGAKWQGHWSFLPPQKSELPPLATPEQTNAIDHFIRARLAKAGLVASSPADKETLIRRATLSLTGLPPTVAEIDAFLADKSPQAFEKVLDHLLASPHYGERMAMFWLDAARYADTDGYQNDAPRTMWPWRDWVIKAYNDNMPFDQFTIEQLAGDMLPDASDQQRLATGFNRNHRLNSEGGALPEEFIVEYAIDRLDTTGTVWLGLTVGCARCHDHKYDPITQKEFYQLFGYFNNIPEAGTGKGTSARPVVALHSPLDGVSPALLAQVQAAREKMESHRKALLAELPAWEKQTVAELRDPKDTWTAMPATSAKATQGGQLDKQADGSYLYTGKNAPTDDYVVDLQPTGEVTAIRIDVLPDGSLAQPIGFARSVNGNFVLTSFEVELIDAEGQATSLPMKSAVASYSQPNYDVAGVLDDNAASGWAAGARPPQMEDGISAMFQLNQPVELAEGSTMRVTMRHRSQFAHHNIGRFVLSKSSNPSPQLSDGVDTGQVLIAALKKPSADRTADEQRSIEKAFLDDQPEFVRLAAELDKLEKQAEQTATKPVPVMVMQEKPDITPTFRLERGQYDAPDKSEQLVRDIPAALRTHEDVKPPANRLELARWIASRDNPLTARVIVNRLWQQHFGVGLVKTTEDFGSQGEWPSHPELLDWLAVEFIDSGWDVKHMHKLILSSATYRQTSKVTPELVALDPANRLLARGPRFRLDGAAIRDSALTAGGLFNDKLGGPPVRPYQPAGLWSSVNGSARFRYAKD